MNAKSLRSEFYVPPAPVPSSESARAVMRGNVQRDTKPELAIRSALHRRGLRFRVDSRPEPSLRRRADVVFPVERVAVFVDGCFWHSCPQHGELPKANREWWRRKLAVTAARDEDTTRVLTELGWSVVRLWEHEDVDLAAELVEREVKRRRVIG